MCRLEPDPSVPFWVMRDTFLLTACRLLRILWRLGGAGPRGDEMSSAVDGASFETRPDGFLDLDAIICVSQSIKVIEKAVTAATGWCTSSHGQSMSATMGDTFQSNEPSKRTPQVGLKDA